MYQRGLVSVVTPFYNTNPQFLEEAIQSVLGQSYPQCELLLVDDGSAVAAVAVAKAYAARYPDQITYLEHAQHRNYGMSASRNLGIAHANGEYVAFLDADDVWLPNTVSEQVDLLAAQPQAAMVYGNTEYWYSWTGRAEDRLRDFRPNLGLPPATLVDPPGLVPLLLSGSIAVPCTCSLLVRRQALVETLGGFEAQFRNLYEDQVFYIKVCLRAPVLVAGETWGRYRQHAAMSTNESANAAAAAGARLSFLRWVEAHLRACGLRDAEVWQQLRQQLWLCGQGYAPPGLRRVKKWTLRLQRHLLPRRVQRWLWARGL